MRILLYTRDHGRFSKYMNNVRKIVEAFSSGISVLDRKSIEDVSEIDAELIITVGGDGTVLDVVPIAVEKNIPVIGVNCGRLGYLTSIDVSEAETVLPRLLSGNFYEDERKLITVGINDEGTTRFALNETTIQKSGGAAMITITIEVDGEYGGTFRCDGIIIATPTGSTAYSLSCGGPIVMPYVDCLIVNFISPHDLTARPFVLPASSSILIKAEKCNASGIYITVDSYELMSTSDVTVKASTSSKSFKILRHTPLNSLAVIREKLGWASQYRRLRRK